MRPEKFEEGATTFEMLDALSRVRPLTALEVVRLERMVRRSASKREKWHWSLADDYRLFRYLLRGKRPRHICILMGRTEQAIWTRMRDFGFNVRKIEAVAVRGKTPIAPAAPKCESD